MKLKFLVKVNPRIVPIVQIELFNQTESLICMLLSVRWLVVYHDQWLIYFYPRTEKNNFLSAPGDNFLLRKANEVAINECNYGDISLGLNKKNQFYMPTLGCSSFHWNNMDDAKWNLIKIETASSVKQALASLHPLCP